MSTPPAVFGPVVVLARHGETDDNAAGRFQGVRNPPLNARGREQAHALAERLAAAGDDLAAGAAVRVGHAGVTGPIAPVNEIWASPYARAQETAEIVAARLGLPIRFDERLKESDIGAWAGRTYAEVQQTDPVAFQGWVEGDPAHSFPEGETLADVTARVQRVVAEARALAPTVLCVCHGGVIRAALRASGHLVHEPGVAFNGEAVAL